MSKFSSTNSAQELTTQEFFEQQIACWFDRLGLNKHLDLYKPNNKLFSV
jgi:hypothetical protein